MCTQSNIEFYWKFSLKKILLLNYVVLPYCFQNKSECVDAIQCHDYQFFFNYVFQINFHINQNALNFNLSVYLLPYHVVDGNLI